MSEDPAGFAAGINFYAYVENNPVNGNDPTGNVALIDNLIGAGVAVGVDVFAQYTQAKLTGQPFKLDGPRTFVAGVAGFATSGGSAFLGSSVESLGLGAASSFALRTGGNAVIGATANVGSTATLNSWQGKNDSLVNAGLWGGGFGALGSVAGDAVTGISSINARAQFNAMNVGNKNLVSGIADLSGANLFAPTPAFVTGGVIFGGIVGGGTSFVGGGSGTSSPTSFSSQSGGGTFTGAAGGFLLYPNKANTNQMQQVYSK